MKLDKWIWPEDAETRLQRITSCILVFPAMIVCFILGFCKAVVAFPYWLYTGEDLYD